MPFLPELNFFYLYLQHHLKTDYSMHVERGDDYYSTSSITDKIEEQIREADFLIADVSGSNANVLYELGFAAALRKDVVLITSDPADEIPADIRHREFIPYNLGRDQEFLHALGLAISSIFRKDYDLLYEKALELLGGFNSRTGRSCDSAERDEFQRRVMASQTKLGIPDSENKAAQVDFLIPRILSDPGNVTIMKEVWDWKEELGDSQSSDSVSAAQNPENNQ
jgi:nucleoside 2-deoxyribosyltransferase